MRPAADQTANYRIKDIEKGNRQEKPQETVEPESFTILVRYRTLQFPHQQKQFDKNFYVIKITLYSSKQQSVKSINLTSNELFTSQEIKLYTALAISQPAEKQNHAVTVPGGYWYGKD